MTISALWLQQNSYDAKADRVLAYTIFNEGVIEALGVTQRGAGANYSVDVAAGYAVVLGDDQSDQGCYVIHSDAVVNVPIASPPGSGSRVDRIIMQIRDPDAGGLAGNDAVITVLTGTPAPSNPTTPPLPGSAIPLATLTITAGLASVTSPQIADARVFATLRLGSSGGGSGGSGGGLASVQSFGSSYGLELLLNRDSGVEQGVTTWYEPGANVTIAGDTTTFRNGSQALRLRGSAAGTMTAGQKGLTAGVPVQALATYQAQVYVRAFSQVRSVLLRINWYNSGGAFISSTDGVAINDSNVAWTQYTAEGPAPVTATFAGIQVVVAGVILNEDHFADDFSFKQKLSSEAKINFAAAYIEDDPANGRLNHKGEIASHLFLSRFYK